MNSKIKNVPPALEKAIGIEIVLWERCGEKITNVIIDKNEYTDIQVAAITTNKDRVEIFKYYGDKAIQHISLMTPEFENIYQKIQRGGRQ